MGSADDFNDTQSRRSGRKTKIIASQREKSTSTMVKDKTTKTIQKKKSVPMITEKHLQANRELLIGQKIKRFFLVMVVHLVQSRNIQFRMTRTI